MSDFIESILQGVDIIIDKRLEEVSYDSTIICTIIDDSDKKNGKYRVSDGSVTYVAYSDQSKYKKGEQVRVSVPMGDFSKKKFILGKYVTDNDIEPITYVSPVDTILNISGDLASGITGSILANGDIMEKELWGATLDEKIISLQNKDLYNTLVLSCNFKTDLANYQMLEGNYGLILDFVTRPNLKSEVQIINRITLDSSEMFGNPYLFAINSPQAKVIKLDSFGLVEGLSLKLYQKGNFRDTKNNKIPTYSGQNDNIFVNNIAIGMGCDLTLLENNKLQLYSDDSPQYKYYPHTNESNLKTMGLLWINKDDENRYVGFSDGIYDPTYDELDYLEKSKVNARLVKYKGKENVPPDEQSLNLAANIDEAATAIKNAVNVVNRDLVKVLREFQSMVSNVNQLSDNIGLLINLSSGEDSRYLGNYTSSITTNLNNVQKQYQKILQYGSEKINPPSSNALVWSSTDIPKDNFQSKILESFNKINSEIVWILGTDTNKGCAGVTKEGVYSGYVSIYDSFKIRLEKIVATMWGYLNRATDNYSYLNKSFPSSFFDLSSNGDHKILLSYKDKTKKEDFPIYKEPDLSSYHNKYCIYWYRYEKDYKTPASESLLPDGWRRLTIHDAYEEVDTVTKEAFDENIYYILKGSNNYEKATEWVANTIYYKCISEPDDDKINIGLPPIYYYTEDLNRKFRYEKTEKYYTKLKYYEYNESKEKYEEVENPARDKVEQGKYFVKVCVNDDGKPVHDLKPSVGNGTLTQYMQHDLWEEKYKVVLFYNHTMYESNELIFTNEDNIPDKTTRDKGDILIFEHLDNSMDSFQSYSITNYLMDERDANLHRQIRCHYDGLLAKDNAFIDGQIYWYVPRQLTMIEIDERVLKNKGFVLDESKSDIVYEDITSKFAEKDPSQKEEIVKKINKDYPLKYEKNKYYTYDEDKNIYTLSGLEYNDTKRYYKKTELELCFYKTIKACQKSGTDLANAKYEWEKWHFKDSAGSEIDHRDFWFKIKPYYQESTRNNYLKCEFYKIEDPDPVFGQQLFVFGVAGTSGTKYTLAITKGNGKSSTQDTQALPFQAQLKDANNNPLSFSIVTQDKFETTWDFLEPNVPPGKTAITHLSRDETEGWFEACEKSCGIIKVVSRINLKGSSLAVDNTTPEATDETGAPTGEAVGKQRLVDLTTLCIVPWSVGDYYIDGPLQIIYNSFGTLDSTSMNNIQYKLFYGSDIKEGDEVVAKEGHEVPNVIWEIKYYVKDKTVGANEKKYILLENKGDYIKEYEFYNSYMPKLFDNTLVPAPLYLDNLDCYAVVEAKIGDQIYWKQPLIILQNRYASSTLNDWDGSYQVDEQSGTIMGTMFGAGRKTDNNTFSGVLMGDIGVGANSSFNPENKTGLGIYGFHDGAQSFGFNIDGTAFLGKAGNGRILFNGNYGIIASANWYTGTEDTWEPDGNGGVSYPKGGIIGSTGEIEQYSNAGMCINLEDGHMDAYNFKLTSQNIYLNSNPTSETDHYISIGGNSTQGQFYLQKNGVFFIRSENFELDAWGTSGGIYINSDPDTYSSTNAKEQYYIKIGSADQYKAIELRQDGRVRIRGWDSTNDKGFVMNSNPGNGERYFRIGTAGGNELHFWKDSDGNDNFRIQSTQFYLNAGDENKIIIDSSGNSNYYFYTGKSDGTEYLQYTKSGNIGIRSNSFRLEAGTKGDTDYLGLFSSDQKIKNEDGSYSDVNFKIGSSNEINTWRIIAGKNFGVTKAGTLFASNARITGTITGSDIFASSLYAGGNDGTSTDPNKYMLRATSSGLTISGASITGKSADGKVTYSLSSSGKLTADYADLNYAEINDVDIYNAYIQSKDTGSGAWVFCNDGVYTSGNSDHPHTGISHSGIWDQGTCFTGDYDISDLIGADYVLTAASQSEWAPVYKDKNYEDIVGYIPYVITAVSSVEIPSHYVLSNLWAKLH